MKKEYIQPQVRIYAFMDSAILAGSVKVSDDTTSEQNAKIIDFDLADDEE